MKILQWLLLGFLAFLGAACQSAGYKPSGDTSRWIAHRIDLGENTVEFSIPPGESPEFGTFPVPRAVDVTRAELFDEALQGPRLLDSAWDYRAGPMSPVDGTLTAHMQIHHSERPLDSMQALQRAIEERSHLREALRYAKSGDSGLRNLPTRYESVQVGGREAFRIRFEIASPSYAVIVGRHTYLLFAIRSSSIQRPEWKSDADAARDAIFQSIRISPR
ncbi:MAG TPA: hypothetical protein VJ724_14350 [Tahibacter sp.]|nr:hypothetical protein [Tahibacter sp.]